MRACRRDCRKACADCSVKAAKYRSKCSRVRWNPQHDLCSRCYRSRLDRLRAAHIAAVANGKGHFIGDRILCRQRRLAESRQASELPRSPGSIRR